MNNALASAAPKISLGIVNGADVVTGCDVVYAADRPTSNRHNEHVKYA